ncbi:MAG TPA: PEP-CTERM sorting domain-containing protein [Candidatus Angelobacter sp.]|nr:PEP-CTERM sorting domain-containing protein [Candidatus Angelobacter sp.]
MRGKIALFGMALVLGIGLEKSAATSPPVLLTISDSNPAAVTITATGADPMVNDSSQVGLGGVDLLGFFTQSSPSVGGPVGTSTLRGGSLADPYDTLQVDNSGSGTVNLNLYVNNANPETFSTTQPAFTGSWTMDLTTFGVGSSALPTPGTSGQIIVGFTGNPGPVIGEWQVAAVPEPATGSLLLLACGIVLVFWRHRAVGIRMRAHRA